MTDKNHRFMAALAGQDDGSGPAKAKSQIGCQFLIGNSTDSIRAKQSRHMISFCQL
jgi:hypothetical protein